MTYEPWETSHVYTLWQDLSYYTLIFDLGTLTLNFESYTLKVLLKFGFLLANFVVFWQLLCFIGATHNL